MHPNISSSIVTQVCPNLWTVDQSFDENTFRWLSEIYTDQQNHFLVSRPLNRMLLGPGRDQEKLQYLGQQVIPLLTSITGLELNLMVAKYWLDLPHMGCQPHTDSNDIIVTYQVYINVINSTDQPCNGVEFLHLDPSFQVPLIPNTGYINLNIDAKSHWVNRGIGLRTSVAFQYNLV